MLVGQSSGRALWVEGDDFTEDVDVILWDLGWGGEDNVPNLKELTMPIVVLVGEDTAVSNLWASGVRTILHRDSNAEMILVAAQAALNNLIVLAPEFVDLLQFNSAYLDTAVIPDLTPREKEVLQLVAEGLTNKAIAQQLQISDHTVKFHINALMSKLNAQSRTEAVVKATRMGLILL